MHQTLVERFAPGMITYTYCDNWDRHSAEARAERGAMVNPYITSADRGTATRGHSANNEENASRP
ncbi:hypothetical protein [Bifidobacterium pseudolongum]|uniref:hypothetical protein n=1 Tax=Bifidobacterium pseudolongum TaxID=1694 RepID=UPI000C71300E|nr:hypothetical protein [Bifidobacterium pseudolongum]